MSTQAANIDTLRELVQSQAVDLINANADGIAAELLSNEEAKLSVSLTFKLTVTNQHLHCDGAVAYSRKFKDSVEGSAELADPDQIKLGLDAEK